MKFLLALIAIAPLALIVPACKTTPEDEAAQPSQVMDATNNTVHLRIEVNKEIKTVVIELDPDGLRATRAGRQRLNAVLGVLLDNPRWPPETG